MYVLVFVVYIYIRMDRVIYDPIYTSSREKKLSLATALSLFRRPFYYLNVYLHKRTCPDLLIHHRRAGTATREV